MKAWLGPLAWAMVALLAIAGMMISTAGAETDTDPSAISYRPSGTAALYALLQRRGYQVSIDQAPAPKLGRGQVAIAFGLPNEQNPFSQGDESEIEQTNKALQASEQAGATVIWLPLAAEFSDASAAQTVVKAKGLDGRPRSLTMGQAVPPSTFDSYDAGLDLPVLDNDSATPPVFAHRAGRGYSITYTDALGLTNRFIDTGDNASTLLSVLASFAPPKARVAFITGTYGKSLSPGLLETIGPWAQASWYQLLFLLVVIVVSLNLRFGLPEEPRPAQRGSRELLDAVSDTYERAGSNVPSIEAALEAADLRLRNAVKLPKDASMEERIRLLPPSLVEAIAEARAATTYTKVPTTEALRIVKKLEAELEAFISVARPSAARRRPAKR